MYSHTDVGARRVPKQDAYASLRKAGRQAGRLSYFLVFLLISRVCDIDRIGIHTRILERQKMLQTDQVLLRRLSVNFALVLPFKDSQGTSNLELSDFKRNSLRRHAPVEKETQYADRAKAFALSNPRSRHKRGG